MVFLRLIILGDPKPKGRPRARVVQPKDGKAFVQVYTDEQTASWEETVAWQIRKQLLEWSLDPTVTGELSLPLEGRTSVDLRFNVNRPASAPKKVVLPLKKPDVDNLAKGVLDAMTTMKLLKDDNIVTDLFVYKRFETPEHPLGVEVEVTSWVDA